MQPMIPYSCCSEMKHCKTSLLTAVLLLTSLSPASGASPKTIEVSFTSYDGYEMFGKLTIPASAPRLLVIYVQTAEGMTVDMKRPNGRGGTFNYFDLYREKLPELGVAFFGYEGRGIRMGDKPPRYEKIETDVYNTSTLENKTRDILNAVRAVRKQTGMSDVRIFLMGASEGTLLAADAAARAPKEISGLILYGVMSGNMREMFKYIVADGGFITYLKFFDTDHDGKISRAEFEADPNKFREQVFRNAAFETFDVNKDGFFAVDDLRILTKSLSDAADNDNFEVLDRWAKTSAAVTTPKDWFKDHFAHQPIWEFLSKLNIPVGLFQGIADANVPVAGVRKLEELATAAEKTKMEFHYFENLGHTLGVEAYFTKGTLPAGHKAIFEFVQRQAEKKTLQ
jgi:alpha-beta hydrolase superfamily lysophospholipase